MTWIDANPERVLAWCMLALCFLVGVILWRLAKCEVQLARAVANLDASERAEIALRDKQADLLKRVQFLEVAHLSHKSALEAAARIDIRHDERLSRLERGVVVVRGGRTVRSPGGAA